MARRAAWAHSQCRSRRPSEHTSPAYAARKRRTWCADWARTKSSITPWRTTRGAGPGTTGFSMWQATVRCSYVRQGPIRSGLTRIRVATVVQDELLPGPARMARSSPASRPGPSGGLRPALTPAADGAVQRSGSSCFEDLTDGVVGSGIARTVGDGELGLGSAA